MSRSVDAQPRSQTLPSASLIIATRNRSDMLVDTLRSVLTGNIVPAEIIVVDQSDTPQPQLIRLNSAASQNVRYTWMESKGLCRANNLGATMASHEILAFTHDDVMVDDSWFGELIAALADGGPQTIVTGCIRATAPERPGGFAPTLRTGSEPTTYAGRIGIDVLKPLNMAMYRAALNDAGWFDERLGPGTPFPGAEDSDLGHRLLEAGYRIVYVPEAIVYHRAWRSERDYLPLRWNYGVAQGAFFAKHLRRDDLYMLRRFTGDAKRRARRFGRRLFSEPRRAMADPLFLLGNVVGAARWWLRTGQRSRDQSHDAKMDGMSRL